MEESGNDLMQHLHKNPSLSLQQKNSLHFEGPQMNGPYRHYSGPGGGLSPEAAAGKRPPGFPPASPYSHFPPPPSAVTGRSQPEAAPPRPSAGSPGAGPYHSRSLSQPAFFSLDSLPPLGPAAPSPTTSLSDSAASADVSMEDGGGAHDASATSRSPPMLPKPAAGARPPGAAGDGLPPRKAHRRSQSDIPFGFFNSSPPLAAAPLPPLHRGPAPPQLVKLEADWGRNLGTAPAEVAGERRSEGDAGDDLFNAYMNLEGLDTLNSSEEKRDDLDSRASGSKNGADSSDNEAESNMNEGSGAGMRLWGNHNLSMEQKEAGKLSAAGEGAPQNRHCRSLSMDSFMGKLNFGEESPKLPPSPGPRPGHSKSNSMDGTTNTFSLEFGNGEFSPAELKKIMANEKLAEMAMSDPKRVKRILANRQSAARSKERKMRYIAELEHKVQTLQTEATTLSAQVTLLQRDSAGLTSQNNELKFRLQAMEQQAQLRDALNEALTAEVQRLKLATAELGDAHPANSLNSQFSINSQLFQLQLQQQQLSQIPLYHLQQQQQDSANTNHESKK